MPPHIGGEVDVLMGILYQNIFPRAVHSLSNGLTIYEMRVTPHDPHFNAVIGGPHSSFRFMAQEIGGVAILFANLSRQLENYKSYGPPQIGKALMSAEDFRFAKQHLEWGDENLYESIQEFNQIDDQMEEFKFNGVKVSDYIGDEYSQITMACVDCGEEVTNNTGNALPALHISSTTALSTKDDENETMLKQLQKAQSEGLSIEYRCPRCRSCNDCRRSFETERVSLREEAEDLMIWDSVKIDWKNKQIICSLPLRGKESEFLSPNRDIALRVLDQQCIRYSRDADTGVSVAKAFKKLLDNGQMVLWKDLTEKERSIICSKDVSHYLVWRVVFKESLSSPSRVVFDGSQKTKLREDGSGGRCLNDAIVKGRVTTLNLVKMVLKFSIGKYAVQGDLKTFYASIKLVPEQWNLQRILYKQDLNPDAEIQEAVIKTLIWGVKSVSALSECAIIKLAEAVRESNP